MDKPFLPPESESGLEAVTEGNQVAFFYDNKLLYATMAADLARATGTADFVYTANWWCDVDVPLGDPAASPPFLRALLATAANGNASSDAPEGAQVCGMLWRQKSQFDWRGLPNAFLSLPVSIFGDPLLSAVNTKAMKHIRSLPADSHAFLDGDHRLAGSHHQKILLVKTGERLVAYVGGVDFNADRIFAKGGKAVNPPTGPGTPLEDLMCRIEGEGADAVLNTFKTRWNLHPEGRSKPLRGQNFTSKPISRGTAQVQISHTYGKGYPFKKEVTTASKTYLNLISQAKRYIYVEDQYLIGTPELANAIRDRLNTQLGLHVIAVMSPMAISDLPFRQTACDIFWTPFTAGYLDRVKIFEMLNVHGKPDGVGSYLHSKLMIVDDEVVTVGSVNFSNRSMYHDTEILAAVGGDAEDDDQPKSHAARVRLTRWSRHLGVARQSILRIEDGIARWKALPTTALVKAWAANPATKWPSPIHKSTFERFIDPR